MKRVLAVGLCIALFLCACGCRVVKNEQKETEPEETIMKDREPLVDPAPPIVAPERANVKDYGDFSTLCSVAALYGAGENKLFSPISLYFALSLVTEGAAADTQTELLSLIGADSVEKLRAFNNELVKSLTVEDKEAFLELCTSLWCNSNLNVFDSFKKLAAENHRAEVFSEALENGATWKKMEEWVANKTHDTLKPELKCSALDLMVVLNTIYLKASWSEPFDQRMNTTDSFTTADGTIQTAEYMHKTFKDSSVYSGENFARCSLTLSGLDAQMHFILPNVDSDTNALLTDSDMLNEAIYGGESDIYTLKLSLPKFAFKDKYDLNSMLESLGVKSAFDPNRADFSNATDTDAYLSKVTQQTYISLNEQGVEASGFTEAVITNRSVSINTAPEYDFNLNRPFLFAITASDGTLLFVGVVNNFIR